MTESLKAVMSALDDEMSEHITALMKHEFGTEVSLIKDPVTDDIIMQNIDGTALTADQYYAIMYFERGWFSALQSVGTLAESFVDNDGNMRYDEHDTDKHTDKED